MKTFQLPLILSSGCIWLVMMAERWVLIRSGSPGDVGGYAAVYQLAFSPMIFGSNFLVLFFEPILYQMTDVERAGKMPGQALRFNRYAGYGILMVSILLFLGLLWCYPMVGRLLLGPEFQPYSWIFPWLILAGGFFAGAQQLLLILSCEMRTDRLAAVWCLVAAIALAAYSLGAYLWQLEGIVASVVLVNALLFFFSGVSSGQWVKGTFFRPAAKG